MTARPASACVKGPFSAWPRRRRARVQMIAGTGFAAGGAAAVALFAHCVVPLL